MGRYAKAFLVSSLIESMSAYRMTLSMSSYPTPVFISVSIRTIQFISYQAIPIHRTVGGFLQSGLRDFISSKSLPLHHNSIYGVSLCFVDSLRLYWSLDKRLLIHRKTPLIAVRVDVRALAGPGNRHLTSHYSSIMFKCIFLIIILTLCVLWEAFACHVLFKDNNIKAGIVTLSVMSLSFHCILG